MKIKVNGQTLKIGNEVLYSHSVGIYDAEFEFDGSWDGFTKYAVFQLSNDKPVSAAIEDNACTIPSEALKTSGILKIGVYGTKDSKIMPTRWLNCVKVVVGTPIIEVADDSAEEET